MIIIFIYVIEVNSIPLLIKYKNKTKTIKIIQDVQSLKWKKKVINFLAYYLKLTSSFLIIRGHSSVVASQNNFLFSSEK